MPDKACPIVLRGTGASLELLAFEHPTERLQLVKGTVDEGEEPINAAVRELGEESGLIVSGMPIYLADSNRFLDNNHWFFYICNVSVRIKENWSHVTEDDGGHTFRFFWHELSKELDENWHPLFHGVVEFIRPLIVAKYN